MPDLDERSAHARLMFDGIAGSYEAPARAFSLFQYDRWHRFLVSRLKVRSDAAVLDVCTGTGLVALQMARELECSVVGLDLSRRMIESGRRGVETAGLSSSVSFVTGRAERLPFADDSFDAVVFTFLLRYVEELQSTLQELARVLRPGGQMASLEFYVPRGPLLHPLWLVYSRLVLPLGGRLISPEWRDTCSFLGPSISTFYREHSLEELSDIWKRAGIGSVQTRVLSLGGAVVTWGQKEAGNES